MDKIDRFRNLDPESVVHVYKKTYGGMLPSKMDVDIKCFNRYWDFLLNRNITVRVTTISLQSLFLQEHIDSFFLSLAEDKKIAGFALRSYRYSLKRVLLPFAKYSNLPSESIPNFEFSLGTYISKKIENDNTTEKAGNLYTHKTLECSFHLFLDNMKKEGLKKAALQQANKCLDNFYDLVKELFEDQIESDPFDFDSVISQDLCDLFFESLSEKYKNSTISNYSSWFKQYLNFLLKIGSLNKTIYLEYKSFDKPSPDIPTEKELDKLLVEIKALYYPEYYEETFILARNQALIRIAIETGRKTKDIRLLQVSDFDPIRKQIRVKRDTNNFVWTKLSSQTCIYVERYLEERQKKRLKTDVLFVQRLGEPLGPRGMQKIFNKTGTGITLKAIRHFHILYRIAMGEDIMRVVRDAGFQNPYEIQKYTKLFSKLTLSEIKRVGLEINLNEIFEE